MTQHSNTGKIAVTAAGLVTAAILLSQIKFEETYEEDIEESFGMYPLAPRGVINITDANGRTEGLNPNPASGPTFATISANNGRKLTGNLPNSAFISNASFQPNNTSMSTNMQGNAVGGGGIRLNVLNSTGTANQQVVNLPGLATRADMGIQREQGSQRQQGSQINRSSCGTQLNNISQQRNQPEEVPTSEVSNSIPLGTWDIHNEAGTNTFNVSQNLVYSTANSRGRGQGDPIRGDLPITAVGITSFTSASYNPGGNLRTGALAVMGGIGNSTNQSTINLVAAGSGGTNTTMSGVNVPEQLALASMAPPSQLTSQSFLGAPGSIQAANQLLNTSQVTQKQVGINTSRGEVAVNTGFSQGYTSFP
jgi:hypothetical protein